MEKEPKTDLKGQVQIRIALSEPSGLVKGNIIRSLSIQNTTVSDITSEIKDFYRDYITLRQK